MAYSQEPKKSLILTDLPPEILSDIFCNVLEESFRDALAFSLTSSKCREIVSFNNPEISFCNKVQFPHFCENTNY